MTPLEKALQVSRAVEEGKELKSQRPAEPGRPAWKESLAAFNFREHRGLLVVAGLVVLGAAGAVVWHFKAASAPVAPAVSAAPAPASVPAVVAATPKPVPPAPVPVAAPPPVAVAPATPAAPPAPVVQEPQPRPELQAVADKLVVGGIAVIGGTRRVMINGAVCREGNFPKGVASLRLESVGEHELVFTGPEGERYRRNF